MNRRVFLQSLPVTAPLGRMLQKISTNDLMLTRTIPSSREKLPVIGLGTWQTFDVNSDTEMAPLKEVLIALQKQGGSVIDSSPMYGRSEEVVGLLSTELGLNKKLFMATKVWTSGKNEGIQQMQQSLEFLKRDQIELMQIHNLVDWQTHLSTLREWKEKRKIKYIGITHYSESAYQKIETILKSEKIDFLQINYSISSRKAEEKLFPLAEEKGVAVLINRPFEEGALFTRVKGKELPAWASHYGCATWGQFFLKFILSNSAVTCIIPGTAKQKHMLDNAAAGFGRIPSASEKKVMASYFQKLL
jgi:diketogulonate reductase-like aldo/keto reductase